MTLQITDPFDSADYSDGYDCAAEQPLCGGRRVSADGVWFREGRHGMQYAAHRRCLDAFAASG